MTSTSVIGDELLPEADAVFDRTRRIGAPVEVVWPWLVQLGRGRAGWYLPERLERLQPSRYRASRRLLPGYQQLEIGQSIPDYGPGEHAVLEVRILEPLRALVYGSERHGAVFTWALLLTPTGGSSCELRLRFRGTMRSRGVRRRLLMAIGGSFDGVTSELMVRGLRERIAAPPQG